MHISSNKENGFLLLNFVTNVVNDAFSSSIVIVQLYINFILILYWMYNIIL